MELNTVEYIDSVLSKVLTLDSFYIPHKGEEVWIDDTCFVVQEVIPYFYSKQCKQNKIRVFINKKEEDLF
jgi:hypothetical protein